MKKYKLQPTDLTTPGGKPLFQVVALRDFGEVLKGDKGGYVESEANLSHDGDCWVTGDAWVSGNAQVSGDAWVSGDAYVFGNAKVSGDAWVFGDAWVAGDAWVSGNALVSGNSQVYGAECNHDNCPKCGEKL